MEFALTSPVSEIEAKCVEDKICSLVEKAYNVWNAEGKENLRVFVEKKAKLDTDFRNKEKKSKGNKDENDLLQNGDESGRVNGDARVYQLALFEEAKVRNTIVTLGTGKGKTLIAIMLIRHFAKKDFALNSTETREDKPLRKKQTWFLVPSVALALQQANTLRSNLPYTVAVACHTASGSERSRDQISSAQIVVATHGTALDLLRHYSDRFNLNRVNLLVMDECHYAVKNHNYALLMKTFYHKLPREQRPRILGLTASPILNLPFKNISTCSTKSENQIEIMLTDLEKTLDARLISLSSIVSSSSETYTGYDSDSDADEYSSNVQQSVLYYRNVPSTIDLPPVPKKKLLLSRIKELQQLSYIYDELGADPTHCYILSLIKEISQNKFEKETNAQFNALLSYLQKIADHIEKTSYERKDGRSCKLIALERTLQSLFNPKTLHKRRFNEMSGESNLETPNETVGIIFVERRITALALQQYLNTLSTKRKDEKKHGIHRIRCDSLTRQNTHVFKYLHRNHRRGSREIGQLKKQLYQEWLHIEKNIKMVLNKLRRREINILIATSVVEEGVDVDACSFVIALDGIQSTKAFIQMKGRARALNAKFFVFQRRNDDMKKDKKSAVTLHDAIQTEHIINQYIGTRKLTNFQQDEIVHSTKRMKLTSRHTLEEKALIQGEYRARHGIVDLSSAKTLINRYISCIPMDIASRSSRAAMLPYLPIYNNDHLRLPAHLPDNIRSVYLSPEYLTRSKKKNEAMLALMACVRLHELNVLNDHMLPLKRDDLLRRLSKSVLPDIPKIKTNLYLPILAPPIEECKKISLYVYQLHQIGNILQQHKSVFNEKERYLCIISRDEIKKIPDFEFEHNELGSVLFQCTKSHKMLLPEEVSLCKSFFVCLMNSRWRRRTGRLSFRYCEDDHSSIVPQYIVASMTSDGNLDFNYMSHIISECNRNEEERRKAAMDWFQIKKPRLWAPIYDPNVTYITLNDTPQTCSTPFPATDIQTYQDYYEKKRSFKVSSACILFNVQRSWDLPRKLTEKRENSKNTEHKISMDIDDHCVGLNSVLLPQDACMETPLADPMLYLSCILLPQFLYKLERHMIVEVFLTHVELNFPILRSSLENVPRDDLITALTAKSCGLEFSYDRFEFLGDAVLKVIHTDALFKSNDKKLRQWISCLHEGDLSALRSGMGCNDRLKVAGDQNGISPYILTKPLSRGQWIPLGLESFYYQDAMPSKKKEPTTGQKTKQNINFDFIPSTKTRADVIEAILGIVYLFNDYEISKKVAQELHISIEENVSSTESEISHDCVTTNTDEFMRRFLGKESFKNISLLREALTHASDIHSTVPSYQRLEWIGDACLCLAAREWIYKTYPLLQVRDLVLLETVLVCNESLAFIGCTNEVHKHIEHCDSTIPKRLEKYELNLKDVRERGIWSADPPKVIADIVESLLGAVHVDGGFAEGQATGQRIMTPITDVICKNFKAESSRLCDAKIFDMMHPKQMMTEICESFKLKTWRCDDFSNKTLSCPYWNGSSWVENKKESDNYGAIAQVSWFGMNILSVKDNTSTVVARNRACALVSLVLKRNPKIATMLGEITPMLRPKE